MGLFQRRTIGALLLFAASAISVGLASTSAGAASTPPTTASSLGSPVGQVHSGVSSTGTADPTGILTAHYTDAPPKYTPAQIRKYTKRMYDANTVSKGHPASGPTAPPNTAPVATPPAPSSAVPAVSAPPLDRNTSIPASGIDGGYSNASFTQEPSTDQIGQDIFQTGNWYAARSLDKGKEWKYLDPFTLFGSGFCCDQVTAYDPSTGHQFWLALYSDHIVLANAVATGTNPDKHWCYYTFNAASVGQPSTTSLDYNDMEIADGDVYVATNVFGSNYSGSFVMRISAAQMATCGGIGYNYVLRTDDLTYKLAAGAGSTMYWGANWGQTNGSSFRVFTWPESSGSYTYTDYTVATYSFYTRNSGQNCGSADGVVDNWCQYSDSRPLGGALSGSTVAFSFNAAQDSSHPFPYTRIVYFDTSNNTYIGYNDIWATWGAIQFNSMAPNLDGQIGGEWAFGGGASGGSDYYPGAAVWDAPPGLWSAVPVPNYYLYGAGNTCTYSGLYRYGDYLTVRASQNKANEWIGAGYAILGANCGSTGWYADPHNVLFG